VGPAVFNLYSGPAVLLKESTLSKLSELQPSRFKPTNSGEPTDPNWIWL